MGQRLNIEIHNDGKVLANAYYHWSAYSKPAALLTKQIIEEFNKYKTRPESDLLYAIRLLESTGAGLTDDELVYARTLDELNGYEFSECKGRNEGLIAITFKNIQETRFWEEGSVYIYLDEKRIRFNVLHKQYMRDWEKDQKEYKGIENPDYKILKCIDINFDDIKFKDIDKLIEIVENHSDDYFRTYINPWYVYSFI